MDVLDMLSKLYRVDSRSHRPARRSIRQEGLRRRPLQLESLEERRLMAVAGMPEMEAGHPMDVMVTETSVMTHHDTIPRFGANPTSTAVRDGLWSDPAIWDTGHVPGQDDVVSIPSGVHVQYDVDNHLELDAIEVGGWFDFATDVDTSLWLNELMVMPSGRLTLGTEANPILNSVTAEIVFTDTPGPQGLHYKTGSLAEPGVDPEQWGNGLIALGSVEFHGQEKTSSYIRLAAEPVAGDRVLLLEESPVGWKPGDTLVLPDTQSDWDSTRVEELVIASLDGPRVTLTKPLAHNHRGPRLSANGSPVFLPHVGNLSRNVILRSENPEGVRGHVAFLSTATVDVQFAQFKDLGRTTNTALDPTMLDHDGLATHIGTNQPARYSMHFHHVAGPENPHDTGFQYTVRGNSIDGALKWGLVLHGSNYGLIQQNIAYDYEGAAFVTEDGTESYNLFEGNFAVLSNGQGGNFKEGRAGEGFWFRGPLTRAVNNVSANSDRAGFDYFVQNLHGLNQPEWIKPAFRGADMMQDSEVIYYNVFETPILQFEGNEVYGSDAAFDSWMSIPEERQRLSGLTTWNTSDNNFSVSSYVNKNLVIDGLRILGDLSRLDPKIRQKYQPISAIGIEAVRESENIRIENSEIRGVQTGFKTPALASGEMVISNSLFQAYVGIEVGTMTKAQNLGAESSYARLVIENTRFERLPENAVEPNQFSIYMQFDNVGDLRNTNEVFLYDFNGVPGANFRVYYPEQAPNFVMPATFGKVIGSPESGLTNAQNWEKYGIAIGGAVAPTMERDGDNGEAALARGRALGIHGLVFPLEGDAARNAAPIVDAGPSLTVEQYRQVQLSALVSDDGLTTGATGGFAHVDWSKSSGPGEVLFSNPGTTNPLATFTEPGEYVLRIMASDGLRETSSDVTITVLTAANRAPIVGAGSDVVLDHDNVTMLRGSASDDGNPNQHLETRWSVVSGPGAVQFSNPTDLMTEAIFTSQGEYVLELWASDGEVVSVDTINVTVNIALPVSPLLLHLKMDDSQASDSSQHGLHGNAFGVQLSDGKLGAGLEFSNNSYISLPQTEFLQPKGGLTAAVWVRPSVADGVERPILVWAGGSWDAYAIMLANNDKSATLTAEITTESAQKSRLQIATQAFPSDAWTHVALTYSEANGGEMRVYRNGELVGTSENIGGPILYKPHSEQRLTVGKYHSQSTEPSFLGGMDDLCLYDYALDPAELSHLMMGHAPHAVADNSEMPHDSEMMTIDATPLMASVTFASPTVEWETQLTLAPEQLQTSRDSSASAPQTPGPDRVMNRSANRTALWIASPTDDSRQPESPEAWRERIDATMAAGFSSDDWFERSLESENASAHSSH